MVANQVCAARSAMKRVVMIAALAAGSSVFAQAPAGPASAAPEKSGAPGSAHPGAAGNAGGQAMGAMAGVQDMHDMMMKGMKDMESMPMSGNIDKDFASMMRRHHQQAIDMAQVELKQGKDARMRAMARKIIAAQKKEIAEFNQWLAKPKP